MSISDLPFIVVELFPPVGKVHVVAKTVEGDWWLRTEYYVLWFCKTAIGWQNQLPMKRYNYVN